MLGDGPLSFREFATNEPLPLAIVHASVIRFLRGRTDAVLHGAHAVNAYVSEVRATQDVDVLSTRAADLAEDVRAHLHATFDMDVRVRGGRNGLVLRVYQGRGRTDRHMVDVRPVTSFPPTQLVDDVLVVAPAELIANKVIALHRSGGKPKAGIDWRDVAVLVLAFPDVKRDEGAVADRLRAAGAEQAIMDRWHDIVRQEIRPEADEDEFG